MTAEEFRTRWTGHVPKVQDVTGCGRFCEFSHRTG